MKTNNKRRQFLVAGLGLFGTSLALSLQDLGYEVIGLDNDEAIIQEISSRLTYAVCGDASDRRALEQLAIEDVDVAVVAIGNVETNMMCVMLLKEMGVPMVVGKATSDMHGAMLTKIGADKVVFPEKDMGKRMAYNLVSGAIMDYIELSKEISIMNLELPEELVGVSLIDAGLRRRFDVNVVAIRREGKIIVNPKAQEVFKRGDEVIVLGTHAGVRKMGVEF